MLSKEMLKHINNKDLRERIGERGREIVESQYSTSSQRDKYLNLYLSVINES